MCEMPVCYALKQRVARKEHKCIECHGIIKKGELYDFHSGVWDGQGQSFKVCLDCEELRAEMEVTAHYDDERIALGEIASSLTDDEDWKTIAVKYVEIQQKRGASINNSISDMLLDDAA